jgi:hypothetical protein
MRPSPSQKRKEKAVSVSTGFVINMGVASVILSFMMLNLIGPTDQLMDSTERSHLDAVGQSVVSDLETADRLAREGMNGTIEISSPEAGTGYTVKLEEDGDGYEVKVSSGSVTVGHRYTGESDINGTPIGFSSGTEIRVEMNPNGPLEVEG